MKSQAFPRSPVPRHGEVHLNLSVARQHAEEAFEQLGGLVEIDALI